MRYLSGMLSLLFFIFPACKLPEGMIATSYDTFELDVQLNYLSSDMVKSLTQEKKSKVAIVEFPDLNGNVSDFGKYVAEELTTRLFSTRRFDIVERQLLNQLLLEQNLGLSGLIDVSSASRIGKMLGVDAIVTGTITDLGNNIRINARLIATETGEVFAVSSVTLEKDEQIRTMINRTPPMANQTNQSTADTSEPTSPIVPARALPSATTENFFFEIKSCRILADNRVRVELTVENMQSIDRELDFYQNNTTMYDTFGNEYHPASRELANKRETNNAIRHLMISGIPIHMSLEFNMINPSATSITRLNLYLWAQDSHYFNANIRNIPIQRQ